MTRAENPPAFAMPASEHSQGGHFEQKGMTLRDYFAAAALQGLLAGTHGYGGWKDHARDAYTLADALLAARQGGGQ